MLEKTVMLKLNGGLGTGMGLEKAKNAVRAKLRVFTRPLAKAVSQSAKGAEPRQRRT